MRRLINASVLSLLLIAIGFSSFATCKRKVFDPLEPINKTVPPNILVVVDNSGSMAWDTRNQHIYDYRFLRYYRSPAAGDYYHYNLPNQKSSDGTLEYVQPPSAFDYHQSDILAQLSSSYTDTAFNVDQSGKTDYIGVAVDVWMPRSMDRADSNITIEVEKDGVTAEIHPTNQWFYYRESDGSPYGEDDVNQSELGSGGSSSQTYTYNSTDVPKNIRDYRNTYSYCHVTDSFTIQSLTLHVKITHPRMRDLRIWLYAPDGSKKRIWNRQSGTNLDRDFNISYFNGKNAQGWWRIKIHDYRRHKTGTLNSWSMTFSGTPGGGGGSGAIYRRYRIQYAFPNFYGIERQGTWHVKVKTDSGETLYLDKICITFNPYVSKITALKTVLKRIFTGNPDVRFALGTYRSVSSSSTVWDGDGLRRSSDYWHVNSGNPGLSVWELWPSDGLETESNRQSLLEWIDMKNANNDESTDNGKRKELFASGFTPIQSCMRDVKSYLNAEYGSDTYESCRNYAVVFLTDGECTEGGCSNTTIRNTIQQIYNSHLIQLGGTIKGTKTYIIGLSLKESDRQWLDTWADAGDDGNYHNHTGHAYLPQNSEELMQAFADAVHSASAQEVVINSDVIFGTINPNKAPSGTIFHANQFTTPSGHVYNGIYPALEANIMFTTKVFYPSWEGDLVAYMPMYRNATDHKLYYFPQDYDSDTGTYKPDYPVIWSARDQLGKVLNGYDDNGNHIPGIRDALGLTQIPTTDQDVIPWRNIKLVIPAGSYPNFQMINLNQFVYNSAQQKWEPSSALVDQVAQTVYNGDSNAVSKAIRFIEFVQSRMLADITYSSPATIYEPEMGFEDWRDSYLNYKVVARHNRTPVVVVGANDGMLHGFNAYSGEEVWAIIPWGVINNLKEMIDNYDPSNNPSGQLDVKHQDTLGRNLHIYGVASSPKIVDIGALDDNNPDDDSWSTVLVCGLGGGGNSYFCLDVTNPLNPQIKWDTSTSSDFADMGETWAYPSMWLAKEGDNNYMNVGFFTSGYSLTNSQGKNLYVMNIATGELLRNVQIVNGHNDDFLFAAPAGILDADARFIKGVYVGTTHGEVYRYDLLDDSKCETFQTNNQYAIITLPAVYVDSSNNEWISIGELGCSDVANGIFANNAVLYTLKAYPEDSCNGNKNLIDLTSVIGNSNFNTSVPLGGHDGYYFNLQTNETMFADPLITTYFYEDSSTGGTQFETVSVFVTYKYPTTGDYCGLGTSSLYIFGVTDLFVGTREDNQSDYGSQVSKGRSGSPVRTGVNGTVWINTPDGPLRIMPLDDSAGASSIPVYSPLSTNCANAKKVGAGSWIVY